MRRNGRRPHLCFSQNLRPARGSGHPLHMASLSLSIQTRLSPLSFLLIPFPKPARESGHPLHTPFLRRFRPIPSLSLPFSSPTHLFAAKDHRFYHPSFQGSDFFQVFYQIPLYLRLFWYALFDIYMDDLILVFSCCDN